MYFIERKCESLKATKRDFDEFVFKYFEKIMAYHPFALYIVCMYFGTRKTSLLLEFCTHYSLLWFSFQKSRLIRNEWEDEFELKMVDGLAKFLIYSDAYYIGGWIIFDCKELFQFICELWSDLPSEFQVGVLHAHCSGAWECTCKDNAQVRFLILCLKVLS